MLREIELSQPVTNWLERQALTVYAEVPFAYSIDLMGVCPERRLIVAVELKVGFTEKVLRQAFFARGHSHEAWACAPTKPSQKTIEQARQYGVGLLRWHAGVMEIVLRAERRVRKHRNYDRLFERFKRLPRGGVGGMPCVVGEGPAQRVAAEVRKFIKEHRPKRWTEVFENVPNHYANAKSMAGVMSVRFNVFLRMHDNREGNLDE